MPSTSVRPNILLVVMDCVRAADFNPSESPPNLPFARELAGECIRYTGAVSPSTWTLPSHASLFTGLYPWDHGVHSVGDIHLSENIPTLATQLHNAGYSCASLSANFLISRHFGLTQGMDMADWGGWWEPYLRYPIGLSQPLPPGWARKSVTRLLRKWATNRDWTGPSPLLQRLSPQILERTYILDAAHRVLLKLKGSTRVGVTSPWIEPELVRWVSKQPSQQPVFCMINLLDAHEPYFSSEEVVHGFREWVRYAQTSQERQGWISGSSRNTPEMLHVLHELYRTHIRDIDNRIGRIVKVFQDSGRWDNTMLILTSDHGQTFGEHGQLFHIFGVGEEGVRVPLWVRFPEGRNGGSTIDDWASLVDVVPTVKRELRMEGGTPPSYALPLQDLGTRPREGPVFTISDSYGYITQYSLSREGGPQGTPIQVATYAGDYKLVMDCSAQESFRAYRILTDTREEHNIWSESDPNLKDLSLSAAQVVRKMLGAKAPEATINPELLARLRVWGYVE